MSTTPQNVVIVGGGSAGVQAFNAIASKLATGSSKANVILVTPRPYHTHLPGALRMVVTSEGHLENTVLMPFPESFNQGNKKVVSAKVASIVDDDTKGRYVVLDNGDQIEFSVLVLTPGSIWEGPLSFPEDKAGQLERIEEWRSRFEKAKDIVLVGGGSIGFELAGEIKDTWPTKNVTIVHSQPLLLNDMYPARFRQDVTKRMTKRGVKLVLDEYVDDFEPKDGKIVTRNQKSIDADLVVPTRGPRPNTKFIESLGPDVLTAAGFVKVKPTLQLVGHPHILAGGDVIEWKEQKQAGKTTNHVAVLANNVLSLLGETASLIDYKGSTEMIVLTNGKNGGAGYFDVLWGIIIGDCLSALIKSKSLMIDMAKKAMQL